MHQIRTHPHLDILRYSQFIFKNAAYGQQSTLLYVCDQGVPILYHQSEQIPKNFKEGQERPIRSKMVNTVKTRQ